ncbi:MAG: hypothetical protein JST82_00720 [Bacteroidetes bacterium]|nr:hypothetical protein [Bacteroidota bacterium]
MIFQKRLLPFFIIGFSIVLIAGACCKKRAYCNQGKLTIGITGYDRNIVKTLVLKRYAVGDSVRKKALDSSSFVYNGPAATPGKKDTVWFNDYVPTTGLLKGVYFGNDWVIEITGLTNSQRYQYINNVNDDGHSYEVVRCKDKETQCATQVLSYSINYVDKKGDRLVISK